MGKQVRVVREYNEGCSRTLLVCPSPDTKSPHHLETSPDTPGMSLTRHQVTSSFRDIPGHSWYVPHKILQTPSHSSFRDVPGLSWDVPHEILQTPSHTSPDIPFGLDCRRYLIMSGQCRRHWTSLITIAIVKVLS